MWEFVRNDIFNANSFFLNSTGQPKPNLKQNQFGGTLGGPVLRQKLFFFTLLSGHAADQRARHHLDLQPDPAAAHQRPLGGHAWRRNSAPPITLAIRPLSDLCRRETARLPQPDHGHDRADQSGRAAPAPAEECRRLLLHSESADPLHQRANAGLGFSSYSLRRRPTTRIRLCSTATICFRPSIRFPTRAISRPSTSSAPSARRRAIRARRWCRAGNAASAGRARLVASRGPHLGADQEPGERSAHELHALIQRPRRSTRRPPHRWA